MISRHSLGMVAKSRIIDEMRTDLGVLLSDVRKISHVPMWPVVVPTPDDGKILATLLLHDISTESMLANDKERAHATQAMAQMGLF